MIKDPVIARTIAAARRDLAGLEMAWGETSEKLLPSILQLADVYFALGQYSQAEVLYARYLGIAFRANGDQHPSIAIGLRLMGEVLEVQGLDDKAEHYYLWALNVAEKISINNKDTLDVLTRLLAFYRSMGNDLKSKVIERRFRVSTQMAKSAV
jgi:tetratricopeptide (TPR) repeat protein